MTPAPADQQRGILLLIGAVFLFTLMDATAKYLAGQGYSPLQIVWVRLAINLALVLAIFAPRLHNVIRSRSPGLQILRGLTQVATVTLFFLSLRHIGLAEATALMDINPILITLAAAIFLGEKIGPRRIVGIIAALIGAMIVLRPGLSVFQPAALLPLLAAFSYTAGAIITRKVRGDSTLTSVLWGTGIAMLCASLALPFVWTPIELQHLWAFVVLGGLGTLAQAALIRAFAMAEASTLAPFGYTGLIWAGLWGWLFFGMMPDRWVVIGALVIVGAGLYVWHREAQDLRRARARPDPDPPPLLTPAAKPAMSEADDTQIPLTDRVTSALFLAVMRLAHLLPYEKRIPAVGWFFAHVLAPMAGYQRRVIANLDRARPDLAPADAQAVAAAVADNIGRSLAEIYSGAEFTARIAAADPLTGPGLPALTEAATAARPVIIACAHFGNYDAMRAALVARGWPVGALYRPMNNAAFNAHYIPAMEAIAQPMFPRGKAGLAGMLRFLRGGGMLALGFDQFHPEGALLTFFDLPTRTVLTPAELALRHDALLVPIHGIRQPDGLSFKVEVGAPVPHSTPEAMMQALNDGLEQLVRAHMGQWFWVHRRWK